MKKACSLPLCGEQAFFLKKFLKNAPSPSKNKWKMVQLTKNLRAAGGII
jgi:hypothetical protein